jgi:hypothetical protein
VAAVLVAVAAVLVVGALALMLVRELGRQRTAHAELVAGFRELLEIERERHARQLSEAMSRIQHPQLVTHNAALDWRPGADDQPPEQEWPKEMALAGQVLNGDEPDPEDAAPPPPDSRVR